MSLTVNGTHTNPIYPALISPPNFGADRPPIHLILGGAFYVGKSRLRSAKVTIKTKEKLTDATKHLGSTNGHAR